MNQGVPMETAAPLLALCLFAAQELEPWQRFPPERVCKQNWEMADKYVRELEDATIIAGGVHGERLREMACDARCHRDVWWHLWWISSNVSRERKEEHADQLRLRIGDRAFIVGEWPGPLPTYHFQVVGN